MIYGVKYRLEYRNRINEIGRVDIEQKDYISSIFEVEGTGNPFILKYNNENGDKSGYFRTTQAEINLYETENLNIDELLTSDETEYRVKFYINGLLEWVGFLIPDFYDISIDTPRVISMTASDRIATLKGVQLENGVGLTPLREVLERCLLKTGLDIDLNTLADFTPDGEVQKDFYKQTKIYKERFYDKRGKAKSCYEIIKSILVLSNSFITQYKGAWYILNKFQVDNNGGFMYNRKNKIPFTRQNETIDFVNVGGRRLISPPSSQVGVMAEFAGGRTYPTNYNFEQYSGGKFTGWSSVDGWRGSGGVPIIFNVSQNNRELKGYSGNSPILENSNANISDLVNSNPLPIFSDPYYAPAYLKSDDVSVISYSDNEVLISVELNLKGKNLTKQFFSVGASKVGEVNLTLSESEGFIKESTMGPRLLGGVIGDNELDPNSAVSKTFSYSGILKDENSDVRGWKIYILIWGAGNAPTFIDSASFKFSLAQKEIPKGNIFKIRQGVNFTKENEIETTIFGDYITRGINGYFYDYQSDDTSAIFTEINGINKSIGIGWTAPSSTETKPLLMHSVNQRAQMFSAPHDILDVTRKGLLKPLNTFTVCGKKHIFIEGEYDFFRNESRLVIEEVKYNTLVERTDYIYSYFDDESIRSSEKNPIFSNIYEIILSNKDVLTFDAYRKPNEMIDLRPIVLRNGVAISDFGGFSDFPLKWLNGDGDEILSSELYADLITESSRTARIDKSYICDEFITVQAMVLFEGVLLTRSDTVKMLRVYNAIQTVIKKPTLPFTPSEPFLLEVIISDQYGKVPSEAFDIKWIAYTDTEEYEIAYGGKKIVRYLNIGKINAIIPELKKKRCFGALGDDTYTYTDEGGKILTDIILEL